MTPIRLEIRIKPRPGLLDPEGKAIHNALHSLGWDGVADVRVGKTLYVELDAASEAEAIESGRAMCRKLLANPVTEDFEVTVSVVGGRRHEGAAGGAAESSGEGP